MKKILFCDHFQWTQAVIEGRKTQTRRMINTTHNIGFYFAPGDVVAVAQSYEKIYIDPNTPRELTMRILNEINKTMYRSSNRLQVRADLMPHQIMITNARVEHLKDISNEDCLASGVRRVETKFVIDGIDRIFDTPRAAYAAATRRLFGRNAWMNDPEVFVYEFKLIQ